jgi:hypothetical protein
MCPAPYRPPPQWWVTDRRAEIAQSPPLRASLMSIRSFSSFVGPAGDAEYKRNDNKVKRGLKEDPVIDGGSSRRFGCGERRINEHTHMGSDARAHAPVAKLWQNYLARWSLTGFSPTSDSSVSA